MDSQTVTNESDAQQGSGNGACAKGNRIVIFTILAKKPQIKSRIFSLRGITNVSKLNTNNVR